MGVWREVRRGGAIDIKKQKDAPHVGTYTRSTQITTKLGPQVVYEIEGEDGEKLGIYGFTNLNRAMCDIEVGSVVRITYLGTSLCDTKFGKKDVHQVRVEIYEGATKDDFPF